MKALIILLSLSVMFQDSTSTIFDFKIAKNTSNWFVVNDGVMGGLSQGTLTINNAGNGLFKGYVTTENNGGFSSIRHGFNKKDISKFEHIIIKIKGDGKDYQFRIKEKSSQRYSYISTFKTTGEWQTIKISLSSFYPSFRGYNLDKPNYSGAVMEEIAILVGNKKKEKFSLEIENIGLE
jgi:hypothetical protein